MESDSGISQSGKGPSRSFEQYHPLREDNSSQENDLDGISSLLKREFTVDDHQRSRNSQIGENSYIEEKELSIIGGSQSLLERQSDVVGRFCPPNF